MRTLKKTLALVLVFAMMIGFGAIGASAFTDVKADTKYNEAITLFNKLGVIDGMTKDTFAPDGTLTRAQAAKLIAFIKLGPTNAKLISSASSQMFKDVPTSYWGAGYIEYCANLGMVAGVGDGKFNPEGKLTVAAFTKLLLGAVGFDSAKNGFTGDGWAINVASIAVTTGICEDGIVISDSVKITRAQACQLSYLALFYSEKKDSVTTYVANKKNSETTMTFTSFIEAYLYAGADGNIDTKTKDVLTDSIATKVFSVTRGSEGADSFGRPATTYSKPGWATELAFAKAPTAVYTSLQSSAAIAKAYNGYKFAQGAGCTDVATLAAKTGNGKTVEVFTTGKTVDKVVVIAPEFVQVTVTSTAATKNHGAYNTYAVTLSVGGAKDGKVYSTVVNAETDNDDAVVTGAVANKDKVLAYVDNNDTLYIQAVDTISGILTSWTSAGAYTIGGTVYQLAAAGTPPTINKTAQTFYVDSFGYILDSKTVAPDEQYAMVVGVDTYNALIDGKIVATNSAILALSDGTTATVTTVDKDGKAKLAEVGKIVKYATGAKGTVLTDVTAAATKLATGFKKGDAVLAANLYANADTKFVFMNYNDATPTGTVTVFTGINSVPTVSGDALNIYAIDTNSVSDKIANVVYVVSSVTATNVVDSYVYVLGSYTYNGAGYTYDVIKGGKLSTITVSQSNLVGKTLYSSITDTGAVTKGTEATSGANKIQNIGGLLFVDGSYVGAKTITAATPVYVIDKYDDEVINLTFADITELASTGKVFVVGDPAVVAVYVVVDSTPKA